MAEHPLPMYAHEVAAVLDTRQTMFRRAIKPQPFEVVPMTGKAPGLIRLRQNDPCLSTWDNACPYGQPGDKLWVQETHRQLSGPDWGEHQRGAPIEYRATGYTKSDIPWRPSIHMPKWASRITLEVTEVRVERVQEITIDDIEREGIRDGENGFDSGEMQFWERFRDLWNSINTKHGFGYEANPRVWVTGFKRLTTEDTG